MTNLIDGLLARVQDQDLRAALIREVDRLRDTKDFGLVFERHVPENVRLYSYPVKRGVTVQERTGTSGTTWFVRRVADGKATLVSPDGDELARPVEDLIVIRQFGEPIYPGLRSVGSLNQGSDKPHHLVINGDNYHVLETLLYAFEGKVDCIYIDPPYNSGARDWKYNNDYVDTEDAYRHSKWLAFMERRLRLAKDLLNPADSVLIVTIDEKEYLRLGMLLEQWFPAARIQMVSSLINPANVARKGGFGRNDEYIYFVMNGEAVPQRIKLARDWVSGRGRTHTGNIRWDLLRRSSTNAERAHSPGCFYPIYVDPSGPKVAQVGEPLPPGVSTPKPIEGLVAVLPIRKNGTEGNWQWAPKTFHDRAEQGRVRITGSVDKGFVVSVLKQGEYAKIERGEYTVIGKRQDGSLIVDDIETDEVLATPGTQWRIPSHDATQYGSRLLGNLLPGRRFPFPKSLYAVEDALRFFISDKPNAVVLDFFGGSGTTSHAVFRLNHQDGGRRQSILVTNNEVSEEEAKVLRAKGESPGDPEWEALGIFQHVTLPRVTAAMTGKTPDGQAIAGDYKFTDEFPMADGFDENVEFFELAYLDQNEVSRGKAFEAIAALLWMKAGADGPMIAKVHKPFASPAGARYAVLFDINRWHEFAEAIREREDLRHVFIVTDSQAQYQQVVAELPQTADVSMLYEDYLRNFEINVGGAQ